MKQIFDFLRKISGGSLTQKQVNAINQISTTTTDSTVADMLGIAIDQMAVSLFGVDLICVIFRKKGFSLIRESESLQLKAYLDTGGVWTIGYGTIKYPNGVRVKKGDVCTQGQAELWLKNDCLWVDACLDKYVKVTVNQNQFDALASFIYNIGETAFIKSTMLSLINNSNFSGAAGQFDRWIYDNGKEIKGLVNRRAKEKALFLS